MKKDELKVSKYDLFDSLDQKIAGKEIKSICMLNSFVGLSIVGITATLGINGAALTSGNPFDAQGLTKVFMSPYEKSYTEVIEDTEGVKSSIRSDYNLPQYMTYPEIYPLTNNTDIHEYIASRKDEKSMKKALDLFKKIYDTAENPEDYYALIPMLNELDMPKETYKHVFDNFFSIEKSVEKERAMLTDNFVKRNGIRRQEEWDRTPFYETVKNCNSFIKSDLAYSFYMGSADILKSEYLPTATSFDLTVVDPFSGNRSNNATAYDILGVQMMEFVFGEGTLKECWHDQNMESVKRKMEKIILNPAYTDHVFDLMNWTMDSNRYEHFYRAMSNYYELKTGESVDMSPMMQYFKEKIDMENKVGNEQSVLINYYFSEDRQAELEKPFIMSFENSYSLKGVPIQKDFYNKLYNLEEAKNVGKINSEDDLLATNIMNMYGSSWIPCNDGFTKIDGLERNIINRKFQYDLESKKMDTFPVSLNESAQVSRKL